YGGLSYQASIRSLLCEKSLPRARPQSAHPHVESHHVRRRAKMIRGSDSSIRRHALTFDVEEHFQVSAFWTSERRKQWDLLESRVERNTLKIAHILASR